MNTHREHQREVSLASDLAVIFDVLRRKAWIIVACAVVAVLLGLLYVSFAPKVYASRALIQIEQEGPDVMKLYGSRVEDLKAPEVVKTFEQSVTSPEVLPRVIRDENLAKRPDFLKEVPRPASDGALQEALARRIHAKLRHETRLIDIAVEDQNPELAKEMADVLVREFGVWNYDLRHEAGQVANSFLLEEADRLKERLTNSEQALQNYKEENNAVSLEERQNITVEKLRELNTRVTVAKAERLKLEADVAQLRKVGRNSTGDLLQIPAIAADIDVSELNRSIALKEGVVAQLAQRYGARHHKMLEARREVSRLKENLATAAREAADVLHTSYEAALLNEQKLELALREQEKAALELNRIGIPYSALTRNVEADRSMYNLVLARLRETDITKDLAQPGIRIVARPQVPHRPVKPYKTLIVALSMLAGLGLGTGIAFGTHAADRSLASGRDAEALLGMRKLAEIPRVPRHSRRNADGIALPTSSPEAAEAFRSLASSLLLCGDEQAPRSILFTSAQHSSGKTFCAAGCAISFAERGMKTLLVDADRRAAGVRTLFFDEGRQNGGRETGAAEEQWEELTRSTQIPNLSMLSTHTGDGNGDKILAAERVKRVLQWASSRYDLVVVDCGPAIVGSASLLSARHVQAVCLVLEAARTPAEDAAEAARRLSEVNAPVVGFVWNQAQDIAGVTRKRPLSADILYEDLASSRLQARIAKTEPQVLSRIDSGDDDSVQNDRRS